jgi:cytochrome c-type biogenesis protein CcmH/NrfG
MKSESIVFAIAGACFGLIAGWIIGAQQSRAPFAGSATATATPAAAAAGTTTRPGLNESQVTALKNIAERDPSNVQVRVELGNLYFDAERYQDAIQWYEQAVKLNPKDPDVSTDLGVSYYYTDQPDRALAQFNASLSVDPKHTKTWLNMGIVRAFGKQDLSGAAEAWEQVVKLAPTSPEGQAARRALDNLKAAHPGGAIPAAGQAGAPKQDSNK